MTEKRIWGPITHYTDLPTKSASTYGAHMSRSTEERNRHWHTHSLIRQAKTNIMGEYGFNDRSLHINYYHKWYMTDYCHLAEPYHTGLDQVISGK